MEAIVPCVFIVLVVTGCICVTWLNLGGENW